MTRRRGLAHATLAHQFVRHIPDRLDDGVLYISVEYGTVAHRCCCGCGEEVVTPLTPTDWRITFDGEAVSLAPSVGNWNRACRSHYIVERGRVIECGAWSDDEVAAERRRDRVAKARYYGATVPRSTDVAELDSTPTSSPSPSAPATLPVWQRVRRWLLRRAGHGR